MYKTPEVIKTVRVGGPHQQIEVSEAVLWRNGLSYRNFKTLVYATYVRIPRMALLGIAAVVPS